MDDLLQILRRSGSGCYVLDMFAGAFFYADDLIILAPTRQALQEMLTLSEQYATQHNMMFSVHEDPKKSKSKCVHFNCGREEEPEELVLYKPPQNTPGMPRTASQLKNWIKTLNSLSKSGFIVLKLSLIHI